MTVYQPYVIENTCNFDVRNQLVSERTEFFASEFYFRASSAEQILATNNTVSFTTSYTLYNDGPCQIEAALIYFSFPVLYEEKVWIDEDNSMVLLHQIAVLKFLFACEKFSYLVFVLWLYYVVTKCIRTLQKKGPFPIARHFYFTCICSVIMNYK